MTICAKLHANGFRRSVVVLVPVLVVACSGGEVKVVEPPPPGASSLTITIAPDPADIGAAQALGWSAGIPGAEVKVSPVDSTLGSTQTLTSSAAGTVTVSGLKEATYLVETRRPFSSSDLAKSGVGDADGFAGRSFIQVSPSVPATTVLVPASRRRSLLIEEFSWYPVLLPGGTGYYDGGFIELYNNSDTTVYLDGMTIGQPMEIFNNFDPPFQCSTFETYRNDPTGIWAQMHFMFPGTGRDYPLAPGRLTVVAQDAIDHRAIYPGLPDLSGAQFEFLGPADVDNPASVNLIDRSYDSGNPHGMTHIASGGTFFLASKVDHSQLATGRDPRSSRIIYKYPASTILDLFSTVFAVNGHPEWPYCSELVNKAFDREFGRFLTGDDTTEFKFSEVRKIIGTTADGRPIVQSSRSSAADFVKGPLTPGRM
jgi:hypothetical protein